MTRILDEIADLLYPVSCMACGTPGGRCLCEGCLAGMASRSAMSAGNPGRDCPGAAYFSGYRAAGEYGGVVREMVLGLKSSAVHCAAPLARLMVASAGNDPGYIACDRVAYVPSTRKKIAERGYNPAEALAGKVAKHIGRPLFDGLGKERPTLEQDQVDGVRRWENVAGAFKVTPQNIPPWTVVLVDDVLTTGATADDCARALLCSGARAVHVLVAARTNLNRQRRPRIAVERLPVQDKRSRKETGYSQ